MTNFQCTMTRQPPAYPPIESIPQSNQSNQSPDILLNLLASGDEASSSTNPASDQLTLSLPAALAGQVGLTDMMGKVWLSVPKPTALDMLVLDIGNIPDGVYVLSFRPTKGVPSTQKVIIQH